MTFWPRRKKDEGATPPYRPLSEEAFSRCVEDAWEVVQEWDPRRQTVRGRWWWNKDAFKQSLLEEAIGPDNLAGLDQSAINSLRRGVSIPRLAEGAFIPPGVVTPAILHGGKRGEIVAPLGKAGIGQSLTIQVNFHGPILGLLELETQITQIVRDAIQGGAFRGVVSTPGE